MVAIKRAMEPEIEAEAKQRQKATQFIDKGVQGVSNLDGPKGRSDSILANYVGVGKDTLRKAEAIVEAAEQQPEIKQES